MIRKKLIALTLTTVFMAGASACQKADNKNTATNTQANSTAPANTNAAVNASTPEAPASNGNAPTDAYKAAYNARKNKDIVGLKKLMSKDIIEFLTMIGQADEKKKQTLDQVLTELCEQPQAPKPDTRNEKIAGDKATIEYLDEKGEWQAMDFIKEDGVWKLTIDKPEKEPTEGKKK